MKLLLACMAVLFLSACSVSPRLPAPDTQEQAFIYQMNNWSMDARISISRAERSDNARLSWEQKHADYRIGMTAGPFNQSVAVMRGRPGQVEIQVAGEDDRYTARSPEALMQALLGWSLPVSHAVWWIRGLPDPARPHETLTIDSQLHFLQAGWDIHILRFQEIEPGVRLPSRLRMVHNDLTVNLVISRWQLFDE
ncbi:lipoprotein insertase outer membrane protein LolB [Nitrincola sp. A-D6]|uniref:lipoprotein insertase outer membrane protein LolB n=1 Tax=Nitrincola sp. A-D6 TaxID=1545442 RepID=UPI00136480A4|nr:lipoprotein insertase outer membrane protein LolB [Nitrincola sp. A-D6]